MPDPNNPLSYIGQSNDPSLKDRAIGTNTALQNLRGGLAQISPQSAQDRRLSSQEAQQAETLERLKAYNVLANTAAGLNLNIDDPNYREQQTANREADLAYKLAQAADLAAGVGLWHTGEGGSFLEQFSPRNQLMLGGLRGALEAEAGVPKEKLSQGAGTQITKKAPTVGPDAVPIGNIQQTTTVVDKDEGRTVTQPLLQGPQPLSIEEKRAQTIRIKNSIMSDGNPFPKNGQILDIKKDVANNRYIVDIKIGNTVSQFTIPIVQE